MITQVSSPKLAEDLIGSSRYIRQLRTQLACLASHDVNLLLEGESGTGKELISRIIHSLSARRKGPFLGVNCAAIHETLLESELFGHEAGAFTGARHATLGFMRAAENGTILLDEVGDMSEALQRKLLRVLEERAVVPVGGTRPVPINVRVISATNCILAEEVKQGSFRTDLYYRLNVVRVWVAPLRERRSDIPLLVEHMLSQVAASLMLPRKEVSPEAMAVLVGHDWPGNVRELSNVIQRAYVLCDKSVIEVDDLPAELSSQHSGPEVASGDERFLSLDEITDLCVRKALCSSKGVRSQAAEMLGVHRRTLLRMMHRYSML